MSLASCSASVRQEENRTNEVLTTANMSYTFKELLPDTEYTIEISAANNAGKGRPKSTMKKTEEEGKKQYMEENIISQKMCKTITAF